MYAIVQHSGNPDASADTCADTCADNDIVAGYSLDDWGTTNTPADSCSDDHSSSCDDNCGGTHYCCADSCSDDSFGNEHHIPDGCDEEQWCHILVY